MILEKNAYIYAIFLWFIAKELIISFLFSFFINCLRINNKRIFIARFSVSINCSILLLSSLVKENILLSLTISSKGKKSFGSNKCLSSILKRLFDSVFSVFFFVCSNCFKDINSISEFSSNISKVASLINLLIRWQV